MNLLLKAKYSFISALVFFLVANPEFHKFTQQIFGGITETCGCITPWGQIIHTIIFFFAMLGLMMVPAL